MRYELNQILFGVQFVYDNQNEWGNKLYTQPLRHSNNYPTKINFVQLVVTEHHRVPGDWDDVIQYDGYLLKDDGGSTFSNQYPRASYGQITDTGNRRFRLHTVEDVAVTKLLDHIVASEEVVVEYHLLTDLLGDIATGIEQLDEVKLNDPLKNEPRVKRDLLQKLQEQILKEFTVQYPDQQITLSKEKLWEASKLEHWIAEISPTA